MTAKIQKLAELTIALLLAPAAVLAQQADPSPSPSPAPSPGATIATPPAIMPAPAGQDAQAASPSVAPQPDKDAQSAANDILSKSGGAASNCYRGFHTSFDYDITGAALTALGRKVIEPGGLCDQYQHYSAEMPIEIGVPLLPGVSVNIDKLCKMVQRPPCPDPSQEQTENVDQAKK